MTQDSSIRIGRRMFLQSVLILFALMMVAGVLTRAIPAGSYERVLLDGRESIDPGSFRLVERPDYPIWRWLTAPVEILAAPGNLTLIVILIFLIFIGGSFSIMEKSGLIHTLLARIVKRYARRKYLLLLVVTGFFMLMGAFFGIVEESIILVPVCVALAYSVGWDAFVGLGMSVLATNLGFTAAITNPFTVGVGQKLAGLPMFSGTLLRVVLWLVVYAVFATFLVTYARRIERRPEASPIYGEDGADRSRYGDFHAAAGENPRMGAALTFFGACLVVILAVLFASPFVQAISDYAFPIVGVLFLVAGIGAGLIAGMGHRTWSALWQGILGIAPAIPLILLATSVKHIVLMGGVLDTILHAAATPLESASPFVMVLLIYGLTMVIELFVPSGSAKGFLMLPILLPLAGMLDVTSQQTVLAYCLGDGPANLIYPTNAMLLISLGLTTVRYSKWLRWSWPLWLALLAVSIAFLGIAVAIGYGPF
ncbi:MAG TPA: hypothetical protein PKO09_06435 [Anaerolineae bacterium]|nr:hypothetical protein [Anaerolineae bacterium]